MRIGFFITARLKSTRLTKKILLDLNGKKILDRIIERGKVTDGVDGVVLCTSTNPQDSVLYDYAKKNDIQFYPGSENDVLQRLLDSAKYYKYDAFISITADNPLFSIYTSEALITSYKDAPFDFGFTSGLPIGTATSMINTKALDVAVQMKKKADTEIWGPFVNRPDFFKILSLKVLNSPFKEEKRLTIDYPEDYELFQKIYSHFDAEKIPSIHEVLNILSERPHLWEINCDKEQRWPTTEEMEDIHNQFDNAKITGKKYASKIRKELSPESRNLEIKI